MITNEVMFGIGFKVVWERGVEKGESDKGQNWQHAAAGGASGGSVGDHYYTILIYFFLWIFEVLHHWK